MRWSSVSIDSSKRRSSALAMTDGNDRTEVLPIVLGVQGLEGQFASNGRTQRKRLRRSHVKQ